MKSIAKLFAFMFVIVAFAVPAFAQEADEIFSDSENAVFHAESEGQAVTFDVVAEESTYEPDTESYLNLDVLLAGNKKSLIEQKDEISMLTFSMDYAEREMLYQKYATKLGLPIFLNWLPGFGTGSRKQGDSLFAGIELGIDITATALLVSGGVVAGLGILVDVFVAVLTLGTASTDQMPQLANVGIGLMIGAACVWGANRIFSTIMPIVYAKQRNANLKSALGLDEAVEEISCVPVINPIKNQYGLAIALKF